VHQLGITNRQRDQQGGWHPVTTRKLIATSTYMRPHDVALCRSLTATHMVFGAA
jgi:hypothetical protein